MTASHDEAQGKNGVRPGRPVWDLTAGRRAPSVVLAAVAIGAVAVTHLTDFGAYHLRYRILNANSNASWSHAVDAGVLAVGAAVCLVGARRLPRQRATWIAIAAILTLLFADEVAGLHVRIDSLRYGKLLYAPLLLALVFCVWRVTAGSAHFATVRAAALLLLASYVIHVLKPHNIAHWLGWTVGGWAFQCVVVVKEGTELAGLLLALLALWGAACQPDREARRDP